ncbi:sigma 54-interacting transcriptional regulator [Pediococcus pentosaceus]|uniref:sigma 54-interacting transcriptional regulator n=1 Tax=Pediococcus pentosaceus TaxID=1255 RepID=UPI00200FCA59|nr:sigma 54-interacting transcriptional regulator [Pediococcus pentosaceus]UQB03527.1 sigma 54-interacting transcriptional regulator [Pediococcus pentosaceus]
MSLEIKKRIYSKLQELCQNSKLITTDITTDSFTQEFDIARNTASHYLNQLVKEGKAVKVNTRPVRFYDKKAVETYLGASCNFEYNGVADLFTTSKVNKDIFDQVIGVHESLFIQIKQLKAAARYPGNGLPILLTGPTGSGKSYLAKVYYDYNVAMKYLKPESKFVHLNCAEYADNPELLASLLFGYKSGAFTGATENKTGLFDEADNGMLFLDEVHRLGAKGQEKLFEYLDNGTISPLGSTKNGHKVNVRLVFATTEDIGSTFLQTFIRRVPVQVKIPSLNLRTPFERESLAKLFFLRQAKQINKKIVLTNQVLAAITGQRYESNVGQLKNDITLTVANALGKTMRDNYDQQITIYVSDLPNHVWQNGGEGQRIRLTGDRTTITISENMEIKQLLTDETSLNNPIKQAFKRIIKLFQTYGMCEMFVENATTVITTLCDELVYSKMITRGEVPLKLFQRLFQVKINNIEADDDVEFSGNTVIVLAYFSYYRQFAYWVLDSKSHEVLTTISNRLVTSSPKISGFTNEILELIQDSLNLKNDVVDRLFLQLYLNSVVKVVHPNQIRCIILAHGYSTASSIAMVVNKMLGNRSIVDFVDMPLNNGPEEIGQEVTNYINRNAISTGLILMVDMGSLNDIYRYLHTSIDFPIGVISNVSTQSALMVGERILKHDELQNIVNDVQKKIRIDGKIIYPEKNKKSLVITCCNTGIGTARQIKNLLDNSIPEKLNIVVNAYDYALLQSSEQIKTLAHTFNILTIVGTVDPQIDDVSFIPLEKLILGEDTQRFAEALAPVATTEEVQKLIDTILYNFTIERVINSLTILDAHAVMKSIDVALNRYSEFSGKQLNNRTRMALYVHVSCLIERLIRNEPITTYDWEPSYDTKLVDDLKQAFSVIEAQYSVQIPKAELGYIYDIVHGNL